MDKLVQSVSAVCCEKMDKSLTACIIL